MQKTCNNCFGSKKSNMNLPQTKIGNHECRKTAAVLLSPCTPTFDSLRVTLHYFDRKQLLQACCIGRCLFPKCSLIIFQKALLWCFLFIFYRNKFHFIDLYFIQFLNSILMNYYYFYYFRFLIWIIFITLFDIIF